MSILHTVNRSPFEKSSLESCVEHALDGSAVLLMEDAVYAAMDNTRFQDLVSGAMGRVKVYALGPDLKARGIASERILSGVEIVDYEGFVDLAVTHDSVQAWL